MFKADTVEQFKIYEFLCKNFYVEEITIDKVDRITLKVTDKNNEILFFWYTENQIKYGDMPF